MARPAASSFAELMRRPVDNLSIEVAMARSFRPIASRAMFALMFVFITVIRVSLIGLRVISYGFLTSLTSLTSDYFVLCPSFLQLLSMWQILHCALVVRSWLSPVPMRSFNTGTRLAQGANRHFSWRLYSESEINLI